MKTFIEIYGWYGALAIIAAYALVSFSLIQPTSLTYQTLNVTGALGIALVSFYKKAYQPGILNMVWAIIAVVAITKMVFF